LRPLRVPAPVWDQKVPSTQMAPAGVTCGLPSSLTVHNHVVREFIPSAAGADPVSSFSTTPAAPRFRIRLGRSGDGLVFVLLRSLVRGKEGAQFGDFPSARPWLGPRRLIVLEITLLRPRRLDTGQPAAVNACARGPGRTR